MTRDKLAFVALFFAVLFGGVAITGFVKSAVAAEVAAEAPPPPPRLQLVEELGFANGRAAVSLVRVVSKLRYGDMTMEYCIVTSANGGVVVLGKEVVP